MSETQPETVGTETTSLDSIIGDIFTACDPDRTGSVQASKVIEYIQPYFNSDILKLRDLKTTLDPKSVDAEIDVTTFYSVMSQWTSKFGVESEHLSDDSFRDNISDVENMLPFKQSTPRQSLGNRIRTGNAETELMTSSPGFNTSSSGHFEKSILEDEIRELRHQNKKYFDEVLLFKSQLQILEENNDFLHKELEDTKRKLHQERETSHSYLRVFSEAENLREDLTAAEHELSVLKKNLLLTEKDKNLLKQTNCELEKQKQQIHDNLVLNQKKLNEFNIKFDILQEDLESKSKEILNLEDVNHKLELNLHERDSDIENYIEHIKIMTKEKEQFKKYLADQTEEKSALHFQMLSNKDEEATSDNKTSSFEDVSSDSIDIQISMNLNSQSSHNNLQMEMAEVDEEFRRNCDSTTALTTTSNFSLEIAETKLVEEMKVLKEKLTESENIREKLSTENFELNEKVINLASELKEMKKENEVIKAKLLNLHFAYQNDSGSIVDILDDGLEGREVIKSEWEQLRNKGAEAEKITKEVFEIRDKLEQRLLLNFERMNSDKKQEITNQRICDLSQEVEKNAILINKLSSENRELIEDNETLKVLIKKEMDDLSYKYGNLNGNLEQYLNLKSELDSVKNSYSVRIEGLLSTIDNLQRDKHQLENENLDLLKDFSNYSSKEFTEIQTKVDKSNETLTYLIENNKLQQGSIINLENSLADNLQSTIKTFDSERVELNQSINFLKLNNEELNQKLFNLNLENQELLERLKLLQVDNEKLIDSSYKSADLLKIHDERNQELLIKFKALKVENEEILYNSMKKHMIDNSTQTEEKTPKFNRLNVQMQKMMNRCEFLETQLEVESLNILKTEEKLQELQCENEVLKTERLSQANAHKLLELQQRLRGALQGYYKAKHLKLKNVPVLHNIFKVINENINDFNFELNLSSTLVLLENEINLCCSFWKELEGLPCSEMTNNGANKTSGGNKFSLKPPTLFYRPVSPDSPNLEYLGENDFTSNNFKQADSAGAGDATSSDSEDFTLFKVKEQDNNESIYDDALNISFPLFENLGHFYEELVKGSSMEEKIEEKFMALVLEFTVGKATIKKRLQMKLGDLDRHKQQAARIIKDLTKSNLSSETVTKLESLYSLTCKITRFAKQYGALEEEQKYLNSSNVIINYAADLRRRLDLTAETCHKFTNTTSNERQNKKIVTSSGCKIFKMLKVLLAAVVVFGLVYVIFFSQLPTSCNKVSCRRGLSGNTILDTFLSTFMRIEYKKPPT